jgi:hypothetical protein
MPGASKSHCGRRNLRRLQRQPGWAAGHLCSAAAQVENHARCRAVDALNRVLYRRVHGFCRH